MVVAVVAVYPQIPIMAVVDLMVVTANGGIFRKLLLVEKAKETPHANLEKVLVNCIAAAVVVDAIYTLNPPL